MLIPVCDGHLFAEQRGEGRDLVLLHSSNTDLRMWDDIWPAFAERYRALRFDARGHGRSSPPVHPYAPHDDLHALLQALGIRPAILVGHSWGGSTALDYTISHPDMVSALVVCASGPKGRPDPSGDLRDAWEKAIALHRAGDTEAALAIERMLWVDGPRARTSPRLAAVRTRVASMSRAIAPEARWVSRIVPQPPAVQRLKEVRVPTLAVVGDADHQWIIDGAKLMAEGIPQCEFVIVPDCAHMLPMEQPQLFTRSIMEFLVVRNL